MEAPRSLFSAFKFEDIAILYLVFLLIFSNVVVSDSLFLSILALPSFILLPCLFGLFLLKNFYSFAKSCLPEYISKRSHNFLPENNLSLYTVSWMAGCLVLAAFLLILTLFHLSDLVQHLFFIAIIYIAANILYQKYYIIKRTRIIIQDYRFFNWKINVCILITIIFAILIMALIKDFFPYPTIIGRTYFLLPWQVQSAERIVESGFFIGGRWADPFFSAISYSLFGVQPLNTIWLGPFLLASVFSLGVFALSYNLKKSLLFATMATLLSILVLSSGPIRPGFFVSMNSNSIMQAIFPLLLYVILTKLTSQKYSFKEVLSLLFILTFSLIGTLVMMRWIYFSNYTAEGTLFFEAVIVPIFMLLIPLLGVAISFLFRGKNQGLFLILFVTCIFLYFVHMDEVLLYAIAIILFVGLYKISDYKHSKIFYTIIPILGLVFIAVQWFGLYVFNSIPVLQLIWNPQSSIGESVSYFALKQTNFLFGYDYLAILLMIIGCVFGLTSKKNIDKVIICMFCVLLAAYFMPDYQTLRFDSEIFPFMACTMALAVTIIGDKIARLFSSNNKRHLRPYAIGLVTIVFVASIAPIMIDNIQNISYKLSSPDDPYSYASIADYEYAASYWLKDNVPETTVILSDFKTMQILNSIGDKIWLVSKGMTGPTLDQNSKDVLLQLKEDVFRANNSASAHSSAVNLLHSMDPKEVRYLDYIGSNVENLAIILVISSRTASWLEQDGINDVRHALYNSVPKNYSELFSNSSYFKVIYTEEYIQMFELVRK